ncbi:hypothetical protein [Arthrobacter sp. FW306-2-2C-D06B]|uniref:hypothetical protein n=1 Tax=Arthrobacter sp. FW306-2-2C-D06B TaxID=2879618 RepID=UPI001F44D0E2|nr:hypothetical protein [Arthrobacter sp. FW306-2-2C-D06B]UKA60605.1 hypothetical protein LFT47_09860 [Arthrobacter sp. FW306-2-2C-D06B]
MHHGVLEIASQIDLHAASITELERSFAETFAGAGVALDGELARVAAEGMGGYPLTGSWTSPSLDCANT